MTSRRPAIARRLSTLPSAAGGFDSPAAHWRSRITVIRNRRPFNTRLRITISAAGSFVVEEFATGGQLAWLYKGVARLPADGELFLDVNSVTNPKGTPPEPGRAPYEPDESYNFGAVEFISPAGVRAGTLDLQKILD